ncbi:MAG: VanW family protein [Gaiellales bacterium]
MSNPPERMRVYRFEEPVEASLAPKRPTAPKRRRRYPFVVALVVLVLVGVVVGGALYLGRDTGGTIPIGTSIDGVDVGDLTAAEAKVKVRAHGAELIDRGVELVSGGNRFGLDPAAISLRPNAQVAVKAAQDDSTFLERLQGRLGLGSARDIPLTYLYNPRKLAQALLPLRQATTVAPRNAVIVKDEKGRFPVQPSADGKRASIGDIQKAIRTIGTSGPTIKVPIIVTQPAITTDEAMQAAKVGRTFVASPHIVTLNSDPRRVPRSVALKATTFTAESGEVSFDVSRSTLRNYFSSVFHNRERAPKNATFTTNAAGKARIIGSRDGRGVDVDALAAAWRKDPTQRITPITIGVRRPALTSEKAQQMGVTEVVGEFFTPYTGGARVSNIKRGAEILDQYILPAHATFSLNKALGERTEARGFVKAPMIGEGNVLKDAVGGGVSQIATTTYNAAFFAGLKLIDHTPHSFWISRYPTGREATVSWGGPELIFENDWDAPIVFLTHTDDSGITVCMLSNPLGRKVTSWMGKPYSYSKATTIRIKDPSLAPGEAKVQQSKGSDGFHIKYGRKVFKDGKLISKETWHWRYFPENAVILMGPRVPGGGGGGAAPADAATTVTTETTTTG